MAITRTVSTIDALKAWAHELVRQRVPYLSISFDDAQERMFTIESKYTKGIVRQGGAGNKLLFVCSNWRDPKPGSKIPFDLIRHRMLQARFNRGESVTVTIVSPDRP